ncbi:MAG: TrkA family potassium uptake protein [Clostridiaceae bacterium]
MYILIIGCGRLGSSLARDLVSRGHDISVIDKLESNLDSLGSGFNGKRIKGVEIDQDTLLEAGIDKADVFLAMTPDDNINIMACQIAINIFGVKRVIARVFEPLKENIYKKLGIETLNVTQNAADMVKSRILKTGSDIITALDDNISIVKIKAEKSKISTISEIEKKYNCIISAVTTGGITRIPGKDEVINAGDTAVCTISRENRVKLVKLFSGEIKL